MWMHQYICTLTVNYVRICLNSYCYPVTVTELFSNSVILDKTPVIDLLMVTVNCTEQVHFIWVSFIFKPLIVFKSTSQSCVLLYLDYIANFKNYCKAT